MSARTARRGARRSLRLGGQWSRQLAEFSTLRPTPTRAENNAVQNGNVGMMKRWDLSPITETTEPPGQPAPVPVCTLPPELVVTTPVVGVALATTAGSWVNAATGPFA
jgi:hypothetical protein